MKPMILKFWSAAGVIVVLIAIASHTAFSHHSFAMYDQTKKQTITGKLIRYVPGSNHAQFIFEVLDDDGKTRMAGNGKPVQWGVETSSAAALARQGITVTSFPVGTIFTVTLFPLRDGRPFGAMTGPLIKCGSTMPQGGCSETTGQVFRED
jgi:hypothetical protein